jgi:hypothetical protein
MSFERTLTDPERENTPIYYIPEVLVLDFDRMLGDVSACMERFYTAAELEGIDTERIAAVRKGIEDDGGSFEPLSYVKGQLDEDSYESFCRNFIFRQGPQILYPDAQRFLSILQYVDVPHVVMTYGVNPEWQQLKLKASGYAMGYTITDTPDKGASLMALRSTNYNGEPGTFNMYVAAHGRAKYRADTLTFIDDKASAFANFPKDTKYKGFWLQRGELLSSQAGDVPPNVSVIRSLDELMVTGDGTTIIGEVPQEAPYPSKRDRWMFASPGYYLYRAAYESTAVYLPLRDDATILEDGFSSYESFWTVPQLEYRLGKIVSSGSIVPPDDSLRTGFERGDREARAP